MAKEAEPISLHMLGGLGDAARRSFLAIYKTDLAKFFQVKSICDIYPSSQVLNNPWNLLSEINSRLREPMRAEIQDFLAQQLHEKTISYFQLGNLGLPEEFIKQVESRDVVNICTPNKFHIPLLKQCINSGRIKYILVEKPLASSREELEEFSTFWEGLSGEKPLVKDVEHYSHYPNILHYVQNFRRYFPEVKRVRNVELHIEESEGFDNARNRDIVCKAKSGGGAWYDMGIHAVAFLRAIGAQIDFNSVKATASKSADSRIQGPEYGETAMKVNFQIVPDKYFAENCTGSISVGKGLEKQDKRFVVNYEDGGAVLDIKKKALSVWNHSPLEDRAFQEDPFYNVFRNLEQCINQGSKPITSVEDAIKNMRDVCRVYDCIN